jgi:hypothetical protein
LGAIRLNIGASDYSTGLNSYNDTPVDVEMKNFSLSRDDSYLINHIPKYRNRILYISGCRP